ncbi:ROK family protein [Mumia sp. zg.B53]|uniref:ROK family protein n=1 Tax=Mumia sp. zg.B53 TaxID=2855449 RepID=UPI001C6F44B2|nr:ROK family protein [Mumia sp. zg.B53]MBW9216332.1 ROK family protein [Mumia sp. zg.B53]
MKTFQQDSSTAGLVLRTVLHHGVAFRDQIADSTGLSAATVGRQVTALARRGLLRERPDCTRSGHVGRPSIPVEVDDRRLSAGAVHIGRLVTTVALTDLRGRVLGIAHLPTRGSDRDLATVAARRLVGLRAGIGDRTLVTAAVVAPWEALDRSPMVAGRALRDVTALPTATADHVAAVAAADLLSSPEHAQGTTVYVYARETVGVATVHDGAVPSGGRRTGSVTHLPTTSDAPCSCGSRGCLGATVAAIGPAAHAAGIVTRPDVELVHAAGLSGDATAHALLMARADHLGRAVAIVRDLLDPNRVVLAGQAFTAYPPAAPVVLDAFRRTTGLGPVPISLSRFGAEVQAAAAGAIALGPLYRDPIAALDRYERLAQRSLGTRRSRPTGPTAARAGGTDARLQTA